MKMAKRARVLKTFQRNRKIILVFFLILILNTSAASLFHSFLSEQIMVFYGKSQIGVLSDLLFLEGAIAFAVGAFTATIRTSRHTRRRPHTEEESGNDDRKPLYEIDFWTLMIIIGAILIGLSIMIGLLLL